MTINTSTEAVKAIIYGLRQLTNEWVASNAANLIEALLAERDCSETKLISGGAAWADHVAVTIALEQADPKGNL